MEKYNFEHIQQCYDKGLTWKEVSSSLGIKHTVLCGLVGKGILKSRNLNERVRLASTKISNSMRIAHMEGRHPGWLAVNLNINHRTFPEQFFINVINKVDEMKNYTILEKVAFHQYVFDFVVVEEKIDIEIDGGHHLNDSTLKKDKRRDNKAIAAGWKVFRISWDELKTNASKVIQELLDFIKLNKSNDNHEIQIIALESINNPRNFRSAKFKIGLPNKPKKKAGEYQPKYKLRKVVRPSKEDLEKLVWETPSSLLALRFDVSDRTIGKWCENYRITKPSRGYWSKIKSKQK